MEGRRSPSRLLLAVPRPNQYQRRPNVEQVGGTDDAQPCEKRLVKPASRNLFAQSRRGTKGDLMRLKLEFPVDSDHLRGSSRCCLRTDSQTSLVLRLLVELKIHVLES